MSQTISLACAHTVLTGDDGQLRIGPARIDITGTCISKLETCQPEEFSAKLKQWQATMPHLQVYQNKVISPALINPHTHLAMSFFRGIDNALATRGNMVEDWFFHLESKLSAEDVRAFARLGAYECLLNGIGLVWDHYYHGLAVAEALADTGLCGVVAPTLQDLAGPGQAHWQREWQHTEAIATSEAFKNKGIYGAFGPHATDTVSGTLWQAIAQASQKLQLPLHAHLAQSMEEYQRIQARENCSPLTWLDRLGVLDSSPHSLLVHSIFVSPQELSLLKPQQNTLGFCPFSALIFGFPADIRAWARSQIPFVVATDCVASNDSMNLQKELRYVAGFPLQELTYSYHQKPWTDLSKLSQDRQKVWQDYASFRDPAWLLNTVWSRPGSMHPQFQVGALRPGALANLVIWDAHHPSIWPSLDLKILAMGDTTASIHHMILAGRKIGKEGQFASSLLQSPEYDAAVQEASQRLASLLKRC